ncbi:BREX system serine/threonine kinase PglW [Singulisphaera acidiphila]|uniref:Nuclease-like protein,protein kinase family protein n=1 Tax=Singulisphaera acidiphila (strain ATCC BAA-1392 / DSM 18658 / VKM B-2454 / MOB10) TaxID=886293 RepID=L0DAB9_SINAD|nr:BREX system serine/threonine kinase PglW [Singulisphaera acidiphila]AGA26319.1 nuclease-like protein,protein kinase family protein [Singulisphaera acidiphila DSM 18658]
MMKTRWNTITPSQYSWERAALDFVREGLPDHDPYRAWSNFEFQADGGAIYEVDLLVLTKQGFWLVECKGWNGRITGDSGSWTRSDGGRPKSEDNPVLLANRKAKALSSLLKAQSSVAKVKVPWLDALVFLSADEVQCELTGPARNRVCLKDRPAHEGRPERKSVLAALLERDCPGVDPDLRSTIDTKVAKALSRAMEQAGIRPSQRARRVGDYVLGGLIADGIGYQDWLAKHASFEDVHCRVRQYTVAQALSEEERQRLRRAAAREFQIIQTLDHPGILPVLDYKEHENGPALLFRYLDPNAIRFDQYLATNAHKLTTDQRLDLLRQVADAVRYAHRKRVIHRALSPQSILVTDAASSTPRLQIYNWQVGVRETASTSARATEVEDLVESQAFVYMSPEAIADGRKVTEASDVFSLGAIAFHLFASRPPASSPADLARILREQKGLSISSVLDGAGAKLEELIQWSTHPDVLTRIGSVEDYLTLLDDVEDELTAPAEAVVLDPLQAKRGDRIEQGFVVQRVLGQGATAVALLVTKGDEEFVLKVAISEEQNARLHEEAEALRSIHSEFIVAIVDELIINGKAVLVLQKAGDKTLAAMLRSEGVPGLEMLARYGDDLLSAVSSLERHGVAHRDIKPDNIGIRSLTKQRNQLILFDFSLAQAPLDNIRVGTSGYTDPFLINRKPKRWDLDAERYSAATTLYEMTLGTGVLPQWGDGKSDPAMTDAELRIDAEKFDPSVREGLVKFFFKALDRDPTGRFHNADEMRWAWQQVFQGAEERKIKTPSGEEVDLRVTLEQADLTTPVAALGLSSRAQNALERANILTVRNLLEHPIGDIHLMRGVGNQTRREIIDFLTKLRGRFPSVEATSTKDQGSPDESSGPPGLELMEHRIVGIKIPKKDAEWQIRTALLGVTVADSQPPDKWPSQSDVADALGLSRARVGQIVIFDRNRWSKDPAVTSFRHELCEQIQRLGGIVTIPEIIDLTILLRPPASLLEPGRQQRMASAVARAAVETETSMTVPRFQIRRIGRKVAVSCSQELAVFAEELGQKADGLAATDPLPPPLRVFQELYEVAQPQQPHGCQPFGNERLLKLAAAMSRNAAVSSRQELYPRDMAAERALRLGIGALSGLGLGEGDDGFTIEQIRDRLKSRYPEADPLPGRPELDDLLRRVGLDVRWHPHTSTYHRRETSTLATSGSSIPLRRTTATSNRKVEITPDLAEARQFEERLSHAYDDGGFLVLTVRPSRMRRCENELMRRFPLERVSFDALLFDALRDEADELEIDWSIVEEADGADRSSQDWNNLISLVARVAPKLTAGLCDRRQHLLMVHPGLAARYDQMTVLETLRDKVGHDVACPGLWLLVATDWQHDLPMLDNAEIPLITPGQRSRVSESWIDNLHRGHANGAATRPVASRKGGV